MVLKSLFFAFKYIISEGKGFSMDSAFVSACLPLAQLCSITSLKARSLNAAIKFILANLMVWTLVRGRWLSLGPPSGGFCRRRALSMCSLSWSRSKIQLNIWIFFFFSSPSLPSIEFVVAKRRDKNKIKNLSFEGGRVSRMAVAQAATFFLSQRLRKQVWEVLSEVSLSVPHLPCLFFPQD